MKHGKGRKIGQTKHAESTKELTKDVRKIEKQIKTLNREVKYHLYTDNLTGQSFTNGVPDLTAYTGLNLVEAPTFVSSVPFDGGTKGNRIEPVYLKVKGFVYADVDSTISQGIRIIIIMDKQWGASDNDINVYSTTSAYEDVLFNGNTDGGTTHLITSEFQLQKPRRYDVLYDKIYVVTGKAGANTGGGNPQNVSNCNYKDVIPINIKISLKKYKMSLWPNSAPLGGYKFDKLPRMYLLGTGSATPSTFDYTVSMHYRT